MNGQRIVILTAIATLVACTTTPDVYLYQGLKPVDGVHSADGVFQDFTNDADTLARIWADPDATLHDSNANAWVRAHVDRSAALPHLNVVFERSGYGTSIEIAPKHKIPEEIPSNGNIAFEMMAQEPVCVGLRITERDGEVWGFGQPELDYHRQCVEANGDWQRFVIPLQAGDWFKFIYGGNVALGNNEFDASLITMVSFEVGLKGKYYLSNGAAAINIRNIEVVSADS